MNYQEQERGRSTSFLRTVVPKMPVKDEVKMSFWQKFIKYRRFPFKFVIHFLLVVFVTVQVFLFASERERYLYSAGGTIINSFLPEGYENSQESKNGYATFDFYKIEDVVKHVEETVETYYNFANESMDYFVYHSAEDAEVDEYNATGLFNATSPQFFSGSLKKLLFNDQESYTIKPIRMVNRLYRTLDLDIKMDFSKPLNKEIRTEQYYLTPKFPSPFADASEDHLRSYFQSLVDMKLDFGFRTIFIKREYPEILLWEVSLTYDFTNRGGRVPLKAMFDVSLCTSNKERITVTNVLLSAITWVCIVVVLLSICSLFLVSRAILRSCALVNKAKKDVDLLYYTTYGSFPEDHQVLVQREGMSSDFVSVNGAVQQSQASPLDQSELSILISNVNTSPSLSRRLRLFNSWHLLTMMGNVIGIVSSIFALSNISYQYVNFHASNILLGLSAIFVWGNIVQYFAGNPKFYLLITSLRNGFPNVIRFIIGALPFLIGYALCGMLLFGSYTKYFQDFQNSLVTLFSSANGDALHDTFDTIYGQNQVLAYFSRIYLVSFVCLFTYCVLNIFILIMEDAYFSVREGEMKHAIKTSAPDDEVSQSSTTVTTRRDSDYITTPTETDISSEIEDDFYNVTDHKKERKIKRKTQKLINLLEDLRYGYLDNSSMGEEDFRSVQRIVQKLKNQQQQSANSRPIYGLRKAADHTSNSCGMESHSMGRAISSSPSVPVRSGTTPTPKSISARTEKSSAVKFLDGENNNNNN